jgi:hypothetical protein
MSITDRLLKVEEFKKCFRKVDDEYQGTYKNHIFSISEGEDDLWFREKISSFIRDYIQSKHSNFTKPYSTEPYPIYYRELKVYNIYYTGKTVNWLKAYEEAEEYIQEEMLRDYV